ncbi:MAG: DNA polymerase III subunit alpha [Deltaproteobacteria bacterium]|nr:DNA polymerase III subunit alpha [Deltaproteobacteria bacterium]
MADFTHLHLHTQYSFLDGAIHVGDLAPRVAELGMKACAVTEHGNLFGAIDFYKRAKAAGVKPILGCEVYVAEGDRTDRTNRKSFHLVLLAKDRTGWQNLKYLVSMGYVDGFYYKPRIDKALLKERSEGLIALTACLGGEVAGRALGGDLDGSRRAVQDFKQIFSPGQFFLELQENGIPEQKIANDRLKQLARDEAVPLIATNDCHYKMREDAAAHDVLMCIQHGRARNDPQRQRHHTDAFYIRSPDEMAALFQDCPEAIENTLRVRDMISLELELGKPMLPTFRTPDGSDLETHLRERAEQGLIRRFGEMPYRIDRDEYFARLNEELGIIIKMNFPGYFLIVADFINWAKEHQIPVGPGRGSGAGSLVAYALRITDLDPLPYHLLFERFLNPERVSMPDFDVDFCQERRGEVIQYVTQAYGADQVGQIATFAQLKAKSVIKDVARALEVPFADVNAITKLLPNTYKNDKGEVKAITIDKALELEPKLAQITKENPTYAEIIEISRRLEGLYRQAGMHAAGIVIADQPLWEVVPVFRGKDDELVAQFSMADVEEAGLVKFDFLGLKTLDVIDFAERHVNRRLRAEISKRDARALAQHPHLRLRFEAALDAVRDPDARAAAVRQAITEALDAGRLVAEENSLAPTRATAENGLVDVTLRCAQLSLDDPKVYRLISSGATVGIFQLESTGFQELLKKLKPDCFEDVVAAVALYRPGPLQTGMVDDFIDCKHGRKKVHYPHPLLEPVLKPTYGGFVYQEQVMQAAQVMARYSLGGADLLRRAMGKKKASVMAAEREKFVEGSVKNDITAAKATEVFDLMEKFAGYGFNKSHSAAYALVTFQTAYLKAYYPVEFMAALLSTELSSTENIVKYISEAKGMGIAVLPPAVNESELSFTVEATPSGDGRPELQRRIRFGLGAIKGLGEHAIASILEAREKGGAFTSLYDFCERVAAKTLNKKALETLVRSGACDCFQRPRAQLFEALDRSLEAAKSVQKEVESGQASLFAAPALAQAVKPREVYDDAIGEWPELERLKLEKEAIGFYVSGHPLDRYAAELSRFTSTSIANIDPESIRGMLEVVVGVSVTALRERPLKDGPGRMAFALIEDLTGAIEMLVPAKLFPTTEALLKSDVPLLVKAAVTVDREDEADTLRWRCIEVRSIAEVRSQGTKAVEISVEEAQIEAKKLTKLREVLASFPGRCKVGIKVRIPATAEVEMQLPEQVRVDACDGLVDQLESLFGRRAVRFA